MLTLAYFILAFLKCEVDWERCIYLTLKIKLGLAGWLAGRERLQHLMKNAGFFFFKVAVRSHVTHNSKACC